MTLPLNPRVLSASLLVGLEPGLVVWTGSKGGLFKSEVLSLFLGWSREPGGLVAWIGGKP